LGFLIEFLLKTFVLLSVQKFYVFQFSIMSLWFDFVTRDT